MYQVRLHEKWAFGAPLFRGFTDADDDDAGDAALMTFIRKFNRRRTNTDGNRRWNRAERDR